MGIRDLFLTSCDFFRSINRFLFSFIRTRTKNKNKEQMEQEPKEQEPKEQSKGKRVLKGNGLFKISHFGKGALGGFDRVAGRKKMGNSTIKFEPKDGYILQKGAEQTEDAARRTKMKPTIRSKNIVEPWSDIKPFKPGVIAEENIKSHMRGLRAGSTYPMHLKELNMKTKEKDGLNKGAHFNANEAKKEAAKAKDGLNKAALDESTLSKDPSASIEPRVPKVSEGYRSGGRNHGLSK